MTMTSRIKRGVISDWWWGVDRWFLAAFLTLLVGGLVLSFAASPPVAERIGLEPFHFVKRHAVFLIPSALVISPSTDSQPNSEVTFSRRSPSRSTATTSRVRPLDTPACADSTRYWPPRAQHRRRLHAAVRRGE